MSNQLRTRDQLPFDFEDGLKIKGKNLVEKEGATEIGCKLTLADLTATNLQDFIYTLKQYLDNPTAPDRALTTTNNKIANTKFVQQLVSQLKGSVPATLDTLEKIADAINNDPNFKTNTLSIKDFQKQLSVIGTATGTVNAFSATFTPTITELTHGMELSVKVLGANTSTTPTFTPNSDTIAFKTIVKQNEIPLALGDIIGPGSWVKLKYDAIMDNWVLLNPEPSPHPQYPLYQNLFNAFVNISTATYNPTLADVGKIFNTEVGALTFTLPDCTNLPVGSTFYLRKRRDASSAVIIKDSSNVTLLTITYLESGLFYLIHKGSNQFIIQNLEERTASLLNMNGYQKLSSGLIIQWGIGTASQNGATWLDNYFPITFPAAVYSVVACHQGADSSVNVINLIIDNAKFGMKSNYAGTVSAPWIAIGA